MPVEPAQTRRQFVESIEKRHSGQLRRFLAMRLRSATADIPDLIQEIYLRVLRLKDHETIRNPQAYLYTIAAHVLYQHTLRQAAAPATMDPLEVVSAVQPAAAPDPADEADIEQRLEYLGQALEKQSPRAYAVLIMYRCEGLTLKQIGARLGISDVMARKYLMRALKYCNQYLDEQR
jgi:RNA polymerase sigma factor (sigma-70 family)